VLTALRNWAIYSLACRWQSVGGTLLRFLLDVGSHLRTQNLSGKKYRILSWSFEYVVRSSIGITESGVPDCIDKMNKFVRSVFGNNVSQ